jgi:hypothetical protein
MIPIVQSIGMLAMNPIMSNANPRMIISHLLSVAIDGREVGDRNMVRFRTARLHWLATNNCHRMLCEISVQRLTCQARSCPI